MHLSSLLMLSIVEIFVTSQSLCVVDLFVFEMFVSAIKTRLHVEVIVQQVVNSSHRLMLVSDVSVGDRELGKHLKEAGSAPK